MTQNTKYEFTGETKQFYGVTLKQIRLLVDIPLLGLAAGTVGGWIESEKNLQIYGNAWVSGDAWVFGDARVYGNALVSGNAWVGGDGVINVSAGASA